MVDDNNMILIITEQEDIPTLKEAREYIGGYVEVLNFGTRGHALLFDADGKAKNLEINFSATELAKQTIVGKAILIPFPLIWGY